MTDQVADLVEASISENTRRAYRADLDHFVAWGGTVPASPAMVASYLATHADGLAVATLVKGAATLSKVHEARGPRTHVARRSSGRRSGASAGREALLNNRPSRCSVKT